MKQEIGSVQTEAEIYFEKDPRTIVARYLALNVHSETKVANHH